LVLRLVGLGRRFGGLQPDSRIPRRFGHKVSGQTIGNILNGQGIEPVPQRKLPTFGNVFMKQVAQNVFDPFDVTALHSETIQWSMN